MSPELAEYFPLAEYWPKRDSVLTALRYALLKNAAAGHSVLELGCGAGEGAVILAANCREYVALDHKAYWENRPPDVPENVDFVTADACELPGAFTGRFDMAFAFETVEHVRNAAGLIRSLVSALKPDGFAVLSTPNAALHSVGEAGPGAPLFEHHVREYDPAEFGALCDTAFASCEVFGLSQLMTTGGDPRTLCVCADRLLEIETGAVFPQISIVAQSRLERPLPLESAQCLMAVTPSTDRVFGESRPLTKAPISVEEAAVFSLRWMLARRNDHLRELLGVVANGRAHAHDLAAIVEMREKEISALREIVAAREYRIRELSSALEAPNPSNGGLKRQSGGAEAAGTTAGRRHH